MMQRKMFVLFAGLVMLSLLIAPVGMVNAQVNAQAVAPECPPVSAALAQDPGFLQSLPPECAKDYRKFTQNSGSQANKPNITPLAVGGPDAFGYTFDDTVGYSWISATTNSGLVGDDDYSDPINIGFDFPFYGFTQSQLYFSTNGLITFGSGSYNYSNTNIPSMSTPNNLIAAFWDDLAVGGSYNAGAIYYSQGGSAPDRYFVVEWRNVTTLSNTSSIFSFETILYENGDIVIQHQSLPASYSSMVGIENSVGDEGLQYQRGSSGLSAPKAIRFYYPTTSTARVLISPLEASAFSTIGGISNFVLTVTNTGSLGADTYDLTTSSSWPMSLFAANGSTPLADTDSDGTVDTGSVAQGSGVTIIAKIATPGAAIVGDNNTASITARSSLDTSKLKTANLQTAIPAPFAQVYDDYADGAMSLDLIQPNAQVVKKATPDWYYGGSMAMTAAPNGNFVYAWVNGRCLDNLCNIQVYEIEYTLLDHYGNTVRAVSKLTDNSGAAMPTFDKVPSVAVAPNGIMGVAWLHRLYNDATSQFNENIYFATLDSAGNLITGPTNLTNNAIWGTWDDPNIPQFASTAIAASDDNRFILSWDNADNNNIWYAVRDTAGTSIFAPAALTSDNGSSTPVLNSLTDGKAILTWSSSVAPAYDIKTYAVINSSGGISKTATTFGSSGSGMYQIIDAVQLPNGKVAVAWATNTGGVQFAILNSSYVLESGPVTAYSPPSTYGYGLSVTTDSNSRVIMTWRDGYSGRNLSYALGDSAGNFITPPMSYKTDADYIATSWNGQGNVAYSLPSGVDGVASLGAALVGGEPGSNAAVGIHTTNHGADTATGVVLTVTLDANLTYVSDTSGITPSVVGNTVTWNLPDMASLGGQDFTLTVGIPSGATLGTRYPISLSLVSNETDINLSDNTDSAEAMAAILVYLPLIMR